MQEWLKNVGKKGVAYIREAAYIREVAYIKGRAVGFGGCLYERVAYVRRLTGYALLDQNL